MAVLSSDDRAALSLDIQRQPRCPGGISKAQLRDVVNALDDWWENTAAASGNSAIPQPQRGILTTEQKVLIFMKLLAKKYEIL